MNATPYRKRLLSLLLLSLLAFPLTGLSQDKSSKGNKNGQAQTSKTTLEERQAAFKRNLNSLIQRYLAQMGDNAPNEEQMPTFVKAIASDHLQKSNLRAQMQTAGKGKKGAANRAAMMQKREQLETALLKEMKATLDKKQFKAFRKAKEKIQPKPQQRGPGGGGQRGGQ